MSGRSKTRQTKAPSSSHQRATEEEAGPASHSPRMGRKEAEHKRRVVENQYYDELMTLLSMISEHNVLKKMDKVTTLREAVICIKVYYDLAQKRNEAPPPILGDAVGKTMKSPTTKSPSSLSLSSPGPKEIPAGLLDHGEMLSFFLDAHDSFLMIVSDSGRILFTTELVTSLLGQMQTRLVGQNIYDYVHAKHKNTIQGLFSRNGVEGKRLPSSPLLAYPTNYFTAHFKLYTGETNCDQQYLPFVCLSFLREWAEAPPTNPTPKKSEVVTEGDGKKTCIIIIGKLPTSMTLMDLAVSTNEVNFEFEMRISREGHIIDIDKHAVMVFGFSTSELIGTLFFEYVDPYHIADVGDSMAKFLSDGIGTTTPYRIRTKGGRCIWLISKGYLSYDPWNNKLNHILLANRVLGCDQVLPEHRFFESTKHLPVQDGKECYVPDLDAPVQPPRTSAPVISNHLQTQSQGRTSSVYSSPSFPMSSNPVRENVNVFPHLSASASALPPLGDALNVAHQVFSNERRQRSVVEGGGGANVATPKQNRDLKQETSGHSQEPLQRELEEKSLKLLEMQKKLMEQEQQFNQDRMQFFRAAQSMMQELSKGVNGGGQPGPPNTVGLRNPGAILDSMNKSLDVSSPMGSISSPLGPPSVPSPHGMPGRGTGERRNFPSWGEGGGLERSRSSTQQQQQQMSDHLSCMNSPASQTSLGDNPAPQRPQEHNFGQYSNPSFPSNTGPMFTTSSSHLQQSDDSRYHSPLSCLPYDCHPSLAEHNMQFYQQQQQQQQQQHQHQQHRQQQHQDPMYSPHPSMGPGGLLQGNSGSSVHVGNNTRSDYPHIMSTNSSGGLDITEILNSASSFST